MSFPYPVWVVSFFCLVLFLFPLSSFPEFFSFFSFFTFSPSNHFLYGPGGSSVLLASAILRIPGAPQKDPNLKRADFDKILSELDEPICPYCKRIFSSRGNLRRHMEIHIMSDRKRFECDICLKKYKRKDYLKEHKMTVHSPKNKWKFLQLSTNDDYCRDYSLKNSLTKNSIHVINDVYSVNKKVI